MSVKKIITYDEILDKEEVFLSGLAFSHSPLPQVIEEARRKDSRIPKEFAFFALGEEGELLGRAGVAFVEAETKEGRLRAGGVWGVRTVPWRARRGVAKTLVDHVHEYYLETEKVDFFKLGVVKHHVAIRLYNKLGYQRMDEGIRCTAVKWAEKRKEESLEESTYSPDDAGRVQEIMMKSNEGLYGNTIRETDFISKWCFLGGYTLKTISVYEKGGKIVGYVAFRSKGPLVTIYEIRAINEMEYRYILSKVENTFAGLPIRVFNGFSMKEKEWLVDAGFKIQPDDYYTKMIYGLERRSIQELRDILGVEEGLFRQETLFDVF